jgi:protein-disulfide isomerase
MTGSKQVTLAAPVTAMDHSTGPEHARVVVVEYADFECPICHADEPAVRQLLATHATDMKFVFRHFPLEDSHPHALVAAEAAEAAAAQGKFWPMHDLLLSDPKRLARRQLESYGESLGLDMARFRSELDDEIYRQRIREHQDGGHRSHLRATPGFFVNGVVQDVSRGMQDLVDAVNAEIHHKR